MALLVTVPPPGGVDHRYWAGVVASSVAPWLAVVPVGLRSLMIWECSVTQGTGGHVLAGSKRCETASSCGQNRSRARSHLCSAPVVVNGCPEGEDLGGGCCGVRPIETVTERATISSWATVHVGVDEYGRDLGRARDPMVKRASVRLRSHHHLAGYTKSAAGRPSHCTIRMARSMPVANLAVRRPVS